MFGCFILCLVVVVVFYLYVRIPLPNKLANNVVLSHLEFVNRLLLKLPGDFLLKFFGAEWKIWYIRKFFSLFSFPLDPNREHDLIITAENYNGVRVRVYRPKFEPNDSGIIFMHGGGFVFGSTDHYDILMAKFVRQSKRTVMSIDYRLAPEHPFPAAVEEDCDSAASYFLEHCQSNYGINPENVVVMGDSAGGNLAAVIANRFRNRYKLQGQILIYPWTQFVDYQSPSYQQYYNQYPGATLPMLDPDNLSMWFLQYAGVDATHQNMHDVMQNNHVTREACQMDCFKYVDHELLDRKYKPPQCYAGPKYKDGESELYKLIEPVVFNPDFSPLLNPDVSGAPPALVVTAGFDIIRDDGLWYVEKLRSAGVSVEHLHYDDTFHGVIGAPTPYAHMICVKIVDFMNRL